MNVYAPQRDAIAYDMSPLFFLFRSAYVYNAYQDLCPYTLAVPVRRRTKDFHSSSLFPAAGFFLLYTL